MQLLWASREVTDLRDVGLTLRSLRQSFGSLLKPSDFSFIRVGPSQVVFFKARPFSWAKRKECFHHCHPLTSMFGLTLRSLKAQRVTFSSRLPKEGLRNMTV